MTIQADDTKLTTCTCRSSRLVTKSPSPPPDHLSLSIHTILKNTDENQRMVILHDLNKISIEKVCDDCWIKTPSVIDDIKSIWAQMKSAMLINNEAGKIVREWQEIISGFYEKYWSWGVFTFITSKKTSKKKRNSPIFKCSISFGPNQFLLKTTILTPSSITQRPINPPFKPTTNLPNRPLSVMFRSPNVLFRRSDNYLRASRNRF